MLDNIAHLCNKCQGYDNIFQQSNELHFSYQWSCLIPFKAVRYFLKHRAALALFLCGEGKGGMPLNVYSWKETRIILLMQGKNSTF